MKAIRLEPKTRKARNRLHEVASMAGDCAWEVVGKQARVGFDASSGLWLLVQPTAGPHIAAKFQRWVHATSDRDFSVHEV